jgi:membrane protease subunit (stomatin/prohibitin family)
MSIWKRLTGEFIDVIEWLDDSGAGGQGSVLVHRFERAGNEIKNGAKLIVREGQQAVFVNEGQIADTFTPGTHTLETKNLPILSKLQAWKHGFNSPFKAEVYFVSTRQVVDQKWGTMNPVTRRDPEFGAIRLRAYGTYAFRVIDPPHFLREITGTSGRFRLESISEQLRNMLVARFSDTLGESKIPLLDMASNYDELGAFIGQRSKPDFEQIGLELTKVLVENISLPPEVEAALDKRASIGIIGNLQQYLGYQAGAAMERGATNPGGSGGGVMEAAMGMSVAMNAARQMGGAFGDATAVPPPLGAGSSASASVAFHVALHDRPSGPFDLQMLGQLARSGQLRSDTLVWRVGMSGWAPASAQTELASVLASPPPLPAAVPPAPPPLPGR